MVAPILVEGGAEVPGVDGVGNPCAPESGFFVYKYFGSWWRQRRYVEFGHQPTLHILDNEVSTDLIEFLETDEKITVQLAPAGCHCRNAVERSIRTLKPLHCRVVHITIDGTRSEERHMSAP